jgi:hypothetical protein
VKADLFAAYAAGFFDGEGWVVIAVEPGKGNRSDVHRCAVYVTQRARHREVLDQLHASFGGLVTVRDTKIKGSERWAEQADWHIHTRPEIERFCRAVQPYCLVKAKQIAIALEYVCGFVVSPNVRDELGRVHGRALSAEEVARRERLRLELQVVNAKGPDRLVQIVKPPRAVAHRDRSAEVHVSSAATISRGEHRWNSRLTEDAVRALRARYAAGGVTMDVLAREYGVTNAAIRHAIRRLTWQHVE